MERLKLVLSLITLVFITNANAQEIFQFNLSYQPAHAYHQQLNQSLNYELTYSGSQQFLDQLKKNQISNPTKTVNQSQVETLIKAGKVNGDSIYPLHIKFNKSPVRNNQPIIPTGTLIFGHGRKDGALFVDSMDKNIIQANDKYTVLQIVQGIFAQLNIPKRTLQIGDTFSVVNPVSIPIGNLKFDLKLTSLYKVISFDGIKAVLQIHQTYTIHSKVEGYAVTVSGNGDGNMEYLPAQQFFSKYQVQTNLQMKIKSSKMTIQLNSKNTMEQSCVVEANE